MVTATNIPAPRLRVLISAGPMRTYVDPVRYVQNRSSGKMGLSLARAAFAQGHHVTVLLGPVDTKMADEFQAFTVKRYETSEDYRALLEQEFDHCDVFVSAAAVLDFTATFSPHKPDRRSLFSQAQNAVLNVPVQAVPDFVEWATKHRRCDQTVIAFAAEVGESQACIERAKQKLKYKNADGIFVNPVGDQSGPETDSNEMWFVLPNGTITPLGKDSKAILGERAWNLALHLTQAKKPLHGNDQTHR